MNIYSVISKNIKYYRIRKGFTQARLAELSGYSHEYIRRIESKSNAGFSIECINEISKALNIKLYYLVKEKTMNFYEIYKDDFEKYLGKLTFVPENNKEEYEKNSKKISSILDKYPNVRKVLHDKEANILSIDEIKALIEILDIEDSNRMITEKEIFFSGGKEAYSYFKKTGII